MTTLEELGLLKMDFLGLRTLTVIQNAVHLVEQNRGIRLDIRKIDFNDKKVLDSLGTGRTDGVFQLESAGMKSFMKELKPQSLEDVIAGNLPLPSRPHGFHSPVYPGQEPSGYHPVRLSSAGADPEAHLRVYRVSGTGYADRA